MNTEVANVEVAVNAAELGCNAAAVTNLTWPNLGFIPQFILKAAHKKVDRELCDPSPGDTYISATLWAAEHAPRAGGKEEALDAVAAHGMVARKEAWIMILVHAHRALQQPLPQSLHFVLHAAEKRENKNLNNESMG